MIKVKALNTFEKFVDIAKNSETPYHIIASINDSHGGITTPADEANPYNMIRTCIILFSSIFTVYFYNYLPIENKNLLLDKLKAGNATFFKNILVKGQDITIK